VPGDHAIGVDLGGTKILSGVVDRSGKTLRRHELATPRGSQEEVLAGIEAAIGAVRDEQVGAVGVGIPSTIDQRAGRVISSVNIPLADLDLRERLRERVGLPVGIDNDANAAAIGEWRAGAGVGASDLIMLTLGTGVGGGLILAGKPYRGAVGAGAELGHLVIEVDGRPCQGACTGRGHLEAYVSGRAATREAQEAFGPAADAHRLVRLANEDDARAREILVAIGHRLGVAIGSLVNVFDPELVVIGGGFGVAASDYLLPPVRVSIVREALPPGRDTVRVERAQLGSSAGLVGAAFVGFEALDEA
jgi:glucokinase